MLSMSLLEFIGLGDDLPPNWRGLTKSEPDEFPLLFRWVEFVRIPPEDLNLHFLVPLEWRSARRELVVVPWPESSLSHGRCERRTIPGWILPVFRLYRVIPGRRIPEPLQMGHSNVMAELLKEAG